MKTKKRRKLEVLTTDVICESTVPRTVLLPADSYIPGVLYMEVAGIGGER